MVGWRPMSTASRAAALVGYKAASEIAGRALVFAALILAARVLPTHTFGLLSLATTLGWLASTAGDFGLQLHLGREVSRQPASAGTVFWPLFRLRLVLGGAALAAVTVLCGVFAPSDWLACALVAAAPVLASVGEFIHYGFRGVDRSDLESSLLLGQRVSALALVAAGLAIEPSLLAVGVALSVSAIGAVAAALFLAGRVLPHRRGVTSPRPGLTTQTWLRDVAPIGLGLLLSVVYFRIDVFLLEIWAGLDVVALYSAVFRLVDAVRLLPAAVLAVALPRLFGARDPRFASRLAGGLGLAGVVVAAIGIPAAPSIVALTYGSRYAEAVPMLRVLLLSLPLLALNFSLTHQLIGWNGQRAYAWSCGLALVVNLALNVWLIPWLGGVGAAWATVGTEIALTAACLAALQRPQTAR